MTGLFPSPSRNQSFSWGRLWSYPQSAISTRCWPWEAKILPNPKTNCGNDPLKISIFVQPWGFFCVFFCGGNSSAVIMPGTGRISHLFCTWKLKNTSPRESGESYCTFLPLAPLSAAAADVGAVVAIDVIFRERFSRRHVVHATPTKDVSYVSV